MVEQKKNQAQQEAANKKRMEDEAREKVRRQNEKKWKSSIKNLRMLK